MTTRYGNRPGMAEIRPLTEGDCAMIERIVARCHVGDSFPTVARYLVSRMAPGAWWRMSRAIKRHALLVARGAHRANREFYDAVMTGRL